MTLPRLHPALWPILLLLSVIFSVTSAVQMPQSAEGAELEQTWGGGKAADVQEPVAILMTGDVMLGRYIGTLRDKKGGDFPFTYMPEVMDAVKTALEVDKLDIVATNLEGPIVEEQVAYGDMVFRFKPEVATLLKKVGFTTLQLSNNHIFNQAREGFTETRRHLTAAGLDSFGHADTPNGEWSFIRYDFGEISVGFLGLNDVDFKLNMDEVSARIQELDSQVDTLIIGIHWGFEYEPTARESIVTKAHTMIDAGADFIWGTHPHVVQNSELYNGKWIYYSLGNFVFDQYWSAATQKGLVLGLRIDPDGALTPVEVPVDLVNQGEPKPHQE